MSRVTNKIGVHVSAEHALLAHSHTEGKSTWEVIAANLGTHRSARRLTETDAAESRVRRKVGVADRRQTSVLLRLGDFPIPVKCGLPRNVCRRVRVRDDRGALWPVPVPRSPSHLHSSDGALDQMVRSVDWRKRLPHDLNDARRAHERARKQGTVAVRTQERQTDMCIDRRGCSRLVLDFAPGDSAANGLWRGISQDRQLISSYRESSSGKREAAYLTSCVSPSGARMLFTSDSQPGAVWTE
jgi:hypothetical protein